MLNRRSVALGLAFSMAAGVTTAAFAQRAYPTQPVRIISDSAAGSSNDVLIRIVAEQFSKIWNQQVIVANHPGGGGGISVGVAKQAAPNGYTLFIPASSTFIALRGAPGVSPNLPIELPRDFIPIGMMMMQPMFIGVSPKLGVKTIGELIELAKKRPGEISFAATGRGRISHLTMELLQERANIRLTFVPYAGGPAAAMNDVSSGRVGLTVDGYPGMAAGVQGKMINALAVTSPTRFPGLDDVEAVGETLKGFQAGGWNVVLAPVGTPDEVIKKVAADLKVVLAKPEVRARFLQLGTRVGEMSPEEVIKFARSEQDVWRPVLERLAAEIKGK